MRPPQPAYARAIVPRINANQGAPRLALLGAPLLQAGLAPNTYVCVWPAFRRRRLLDRPPPSPRGHWNSALLRDRAEAMRTLACPGAPCQPTCDGHGHPDRTSQRNHPDRLEAARPDSGRGGPRRRRLGDRASAPRPGVTQLLGNDLRTGAMGRLARLHGRRESLEKIFATRMW